MAKAKKKTAKKPAKAVKKPAKKKPAQKSTAKKPAKSKRVAKKPAPKKTSSVKAAKPAHKRAPVIKTAPSAAELAKAAIAGDLEVLARMVDGSRDAYKWFTVASDFGHADADARIAELQENGEDTHAANAHFELGVGYLTGSDGLPVDLDKARSQLANAKEHQFGDASTLQRVRGRLDADALVVFDAVYDTRAPAGGADTAWGNEHTHNDPAPSDDDGGDDDDE